MDWRKVDERLIRRGMLLLEFGFVNGYDDELKRMNEGKLGRPFKLTDSYVKFIGVVRYLFSIGFRQLEGFTITLHKDGAGHVPADCWQMQPMAERLVAAEKPSVEPERFPVQFSTGI